MENTTLPNGPESSSPVFSPAPMAGRRLGIDATAGGKPQGAVGTGFAHPLLQTPRLPWAWLPMPLLLGTTCVLLVWRVPGAYESPYLLLGLNFVFAMLASLLTAYLAFRAFLINGRPDTLILGCGLLTWGGAMTLATIFVRIGPNEQVTVHNLCVLLAAMCHFAAAVVRWRPAKMINAAGFWLALGIFGTVAMTGLVAIAAVAGWMPVFFIPGAGGTPVRQAVLWMSIGMFTLTAGLMGKEYRRAPSAFLYWYASGLALIAVGLFGVMVQSIPGSIIGWVGRTAQFLGGAYILMAAFAALRESRVWGQPLELVLRDTQAQLRDRIERYELVLAGANAALWDWDLVNQRIVFSPQWKVLHGFDEDDGVDQEETWRESIHPDDRDRVSAALQRHFEGQTAAFAEEYRIVSQDGTVKWIFDRGLAQRDATGRVVRMAGSETDITERKQAEEALKAALAQAEEGDRMLTALMEYVPEGITICDVTGKVRRVSRQGREMLGGPHDGKSIEEIVRNWTVYRPDGQMTLPTMELPLVRALEGEAVRDVELVQQRDGGEKLTLLCNAAPIRNAEGDIVGGIVTWQNISERKAAEKALRESEERLQLAWMATRDVIWDWDVVKDTLRWNSAGAEVFGWTDAIHEPQNAAWWLARVHPDDRQRVSEDFYRVTGNTSLHQWKDEYRFLRRDGTTAHVLDRGFVVRDPSGNAKRMIGAMQDITELKESEQALLDTNEELSEYTYAVVHNLKAPFRAVQNYANFLIEDLGDRLEGEPRQFLDGINSALKEAQLQFSDLDALYRIRKYEPEFEAIDPHELLEDIAVTHRSTPERKLVVAEKWPLVWGEGFLLRQILDELISNGFKYNLSEIKTIEVGWRAAAENRVEIVVADNGIGIDPQYHEHIFHIFKRLHTEEEYEGTGIGLAIVRRAARKIGGHLRIQSAVGEGSTFVISLPAAATREGRADPLDAAASAIPHPA